MAKTLLESFEQTASTANTTQYWPAQGYLKPTTTEANAQIILRSAGTLSNMLVYVPANSVAGTSTFRSRKNVTNGGQSVSVGSSATGTFEDTTNTDTITAGDKVNLQTVPGATTNTYTLQIISFLYAATTNTYAMHATNDVAGLAISTASATRYFTLSGRMATLSTAESDEQCKMTVAATGKNLFCRISANARTTTTTVRTRKNTANGGQSVSIGSTATGFFEDTTNTDTIAVNDLYTYQYVSSTGTQSITLVQIGVGIETTSSKGLLSTGIVFGESSSATEVWYYAPNGDISGFGTEASVATKVRAAFTTSNLGIKIITNSITATTTVTSRKNSAAGNQSVAIGSSTTGQFADTTNTDTLVATDTYHYKYAAGATGTSQIKNSIVGWTTLASSTTFQRTASDTTSVSEAVVKKAVKLRADTGSNSETF